MALPHNWMYAEGVTAESAVLGVGERKDYIPQSGVSFGGE